MGEAWQASNTHARVKRCVIMVLFLHLGNVMNTETSFEQEKMWTSYLIEVPRRFKSLPSSVEWALIYLIPFYGAGRWSVKSSKLTIIPSAFFPLKTSSNLWWHVVKQQGNERYTMSCTIRCRNDPYLITNKSLRDALAEAQTSHSNHILVNTSSDTTCHRYAGNQQRNKKMADLSYHSSHPFPLSVNGTS